MQSAFRELMEKVPADGAIITDATHPNIAPLLAGLAPRIIDYKTSDTYALRVPAEFNQMNARAAAAAARFAWKSITEDSITTSLSHFHGTWRRFEERALPRAGQRCMTTTRTTPPLLRRHSQN